MVKKKCLTCHILPHPKPPPEKNKCPGAYNCPRAKNKNDTLFGPNQASKYRGENYAGRIFCRHKLCRVQILQPSLKRGYKSCSRRRRRRKFWAFLHTKHRKILKKELQILQPSLKRGYKSCRISSAEFVSAEFVPRIISPPR